MNKVAVIAVTLGVLTGLMAAPAQAQQQQTINQKARQKASWYNSPREIQIIDERPMVRDFREAPQTPQSIALPPGPGAAKPGQYGGGAGAMPEGGDVIPSGGMPIGGQGDPGYRTPIETSPVGLDKADLNHRPSNIPAAGLGPKGPLPGGFSTGIHGRVSPPNYAQGQSAGPALAGNRSGPAVKAPVVNSYTAGGGYGQSVGTGGGAGGANISLTGKLLKKQN
jgi:hypothetical protein